MKKSAIVLFFAATMLSFSVKAQNIQEGINHLYAERYQSAKNIFDKLSSSNNPEGTYWLGQTYIKMKDTAAALSVYQKALAANPNSGLALAGMGHLELMQGKTAEAKQHFETAISVSHGKKGDDPNVLNAVGRANVEAKAGDAAYAVEKLNQAAQLAPKNAEILINLGNAYRKAHEGGQAVTTYMKATQLNPSFAAPYYRMAKLYQTQQPYSEIVLNNLNSALTADPKFAPAYLDLYYYNLLYPKDFAKAGEYANKYISSTDPSVENDYLKAQTLFVQKNYDEAIAIGKNIIEKAGEKVNPRVLRMEAYAHIEKGDTIGARQYVDQFFAKADADDIVPQDYIMQADAYAKDNPNIVREAYFKAAQADTLLANQIKFLNQGIERFHKTGQKVSEADLRYLSYKLRGSSANPTELISYMAVPYYQGGAFQMADSVAQMYIAIAPDSIYGHLWSARSLARLDTSMELGTAIDAYNKLLDVASKDKVRFKPYGVEAAGYLAGYYNNIKKDKETAITYLKRAMEFDPTNASIQSNIDILSKAGTPAPKPQGEGKQKTKTTTPKGQVKQKTK
jgi:tetratricopeptide (TPR) repeat protein